MKVFLTIENLALTENSQWAKKEKESSKSMRNSFGYKMWRKIKLIRRFWSHVKGFVSVPWDWHWSTLLCEITHQLYYQPYFKEFSLTNLRKQFQTPFLHLILNICKPYIPLLSNELSDLCLKHFFNIILSNPLICCMNISSAWQYVKTTGFKNLIYFPETIYWDNFKLLNL